MNIDHIAVAPTGVYVIDAKKYKGRPQLKIEGGFLRPRVEKLLVGTRDCTKLVDGVLKQVDIVRGLVGDDLPIHGVLCFVEADWPLIGGSFTTRGVEALWPKRLYPKLNATGPLLTQAVAEVHRRLASSLPAPVTDDRCAPSRWIAAGLGCSHRHPGRTYSLAKPRTRCSDHADMTN